MTIWLKPVKVISSMRPGNDPCKHLTRHYYQHIIDPARSKSSRSYFKCCPLTVMQCPTFPRTPWLPTDRLPAVSHIARYKELWAQIHLTEIRTLLVTSKSMAKIRSCNLRIWCRPKKIPSQLSSKLVKHWCCFVKPLSISCRQTRCPLVSACCATCKSSLLEKHYYTSAVSVWLDFGTKAT